MLTEEDINKLMAAFATKQELNEFRNETNDSFDRIENRVESISIGVDKILDRFEEHLVIEAQVERHDRQIKTIGKEFKLELPV